MDVVGREEIPVAAAAVHERRRQLAVELGLRLGYDARQPRDAVRGVGLGGHLRLVEHDGRRPAALDVEEVVAAHEFDGERGVPGRLAAGGEVLRVVVKMLGGEPIGGEEGLLVRGEVGGGAALALAVKPVGFLP